MTLTPNRDAAGAAAAEARRIHADVIARDDADGIGQRMAIEAAEAIVGGAADMLDRSINPQLIWPQVAKALAGPLSAFLMSATGGDPDRAIDLLPGALASIQELALARLHQGEAAFSKGEAPGGHPAGRA
ncbi:hypothetical protein OMR07_02135 [Methylobacterium organophilum]|nr:hypothetical protein [Methylobacterium organophilum]